MSRVRARAGTDAGGWFDVPPIADARDRDRWAGAVADAVARAHGDRFDPEAGPVIRSLASQVAASRQDADLLVLGFVPTARAIMATVRVSLIEPQPLERWRSLGFALTPVHAAGAGHGMHAARTVENWIGGSRLVAQQSVFVFTEGDLGVIVSVDPTAAVVFDRMQEGLIDIVGSLTLEFEDGRRFVGESIPGLLGAGDDTWDIGMHVAA